MCHSNDFYREKLFNQWFTKTTKIYDRQTNNKMCDTDIKIENPSFVRTFVKAYKSNYKYYDTPQDCYTDCMALVWEGMINFEIKDGSTWDKIATGEDDINLRRLINYLRSYVSNGIKRLNGDLIETTRIANDENGKRIIHIFYNIVPETLNRTIAVDKSLEKTEVIDTVTNSFWDSKHKYKYNMFCSWASENYDRILTQSQKKFLKSLVDVNYSTLDKDHCLDELGLKKQDIQPRLKRISEKFYEKYLQEQKFLTGGFAIKDLDNELKSYGNYINTLYSDNIDPNELNNRLSSIIVNSIDNKYFNKLIYDKLSDYSRKWILRVYRYDVVLYEENFKLYRAKIQLPSKVIYEVTRIVEDRIEKLEQLKDAEIIKLENEKDKKDVSVKTIYFELPQGHNIVYLNMNANGIIM